MSDRPIIQDKNKLTIYAEHKNKEYIVYFKEIGDILYYTFSGRCFMEEFIYRSGYETFTYKSSNGKEIDKKWEYIDEKIEDWKHWHGTKTKILPKKYSWDDYVCGHFIKQ